MKRKYWMADYVDPINGQAPQRQIMKRTLPSAVGPSNPRPAQWSFWVAALVLSGCVFCGNSFGQGLRREWVRTYSLDATKVNQSSAIAIAPDGNIVVAGSSQNASGDFDYQVVKYTPSGGEVWEARYGSANRGDDQFRGMAIDPAGNVIVTGTSDTVKFSRDGVFVWSVPLSGRGVAANSQFVYVTGFLPLDIATAQLQNNDIDGKENWRKIVDGHSHRDDMGQTITLDESGNVYVAGQENYQPCSNIGICHYTVAIASYTPEGLQRFFGDAVIGDWTQPYAQAPGVDTRKIMLAPSGAIFVYATYGDIAELVEFDKSGAYVRGAPGRLLQADVAKKALLLPNGTIVGAGSRQNPDFSGVPAVLTSFTPDFAYSNVWRYGGNGGVACATDLALDSREVVYVTGFDDNDRDSASTALFLARVTQSGQTLDLDRFNSPDGIKTISAALAVDSHDNAYVTGYILNAQGGSEFVTIKYTATPKIEQSANGAVHLEFHANPGQLYSLESTTDFFNWQGVITNTADANGLILFDDTNAVTIPYRFYRGNAAP